LSKRLLQISIAYATTDSLEPGWFFVKTAATQVVVQAVLSMNNDVKDSKEETEWPSAREIFEDILGTRGPSARELPDPLRKSQRSTASTSATKMDEEKTASEKSPHELESEQRPEAPAEQLVSPAPSS